MIIKFSLKTFVFSSILFLFIGCDSEETKTYKSGMSSALSSLEIYSRLQSAYFMETDSFGTVDQIGWDVKDHNFKFVSYKKGQLSAILKRRGPCDINEISMQVTVFPSYSKKSLLEIAELCSPYIDFEGNQYMEPEIKFEIKKGK